MVHAEVKAYRMVVDPGCMKCMDCVSVCPNDALYIGFGKPAIAVPKSKTAKRSYSLTWPEEILGAAVFLGSLLSVRGVYALVPFLMALGCASVTTFLTLKTWRLLAANELSFYHFSLKSGGRIRKAGWAFLGFAILWIGSNAHSGWIRFHEFEGDRAFQRIEIPDELALAQPNPARWISPTERDNILAGEEHLHAALKFGLFANGEALARLAWFEYLSGDSEESVKLLGQAAAYQKGPGRALSLYYRGAVLNRLGQYEQACTSLDEALGEREDLILARQEKGESLWQLGRKEEAISVWTDALQRNPSLALTSNLLSGAERSLGRFEEATAHEKQADQFTPDNALYHWMIGLRLKNLGMNDLAGRHLQRAIQLDPGSRNEGE
jgi:tetratricopeptide (TPR) repeat protein